LATLNAVFAETTLRPAVFGPPYVARLNTATRSPALVDEHFALTATPVDTTTAIGVLEAPCAAASA
jgi:hypothetical protein